MEKLSAQQFAVYAAAIIAIALIGARYLAAGNEGSSTAVSDKPRPVAVQRSKSSVFVYVTGAVERPGVYRLPPWARLDLALRRAGGARDGADLAAVNLAAKVADGQQVVVPRRVAGAGVPGAESAEGAEGAEAGPISLNTATPDQLDQLDGVGPATARKILDWRTQHGGFRSVEDLKQIGGIGPKRFEALKDKVRM